MKNNRIKVFQLDTRISKCFVLFLDITVGFCLICGGRIIYDDVHHKNNMHQINIIILCSNSSLVLAAACY